MRFDTNIHLQVYLLPGNPCFQSCLSSNVFVLEQRCVDRYAITFVIASRATRRGRTLFVGAKTTPKSACYHCRQICYKCQYIVYAVNGSARQLSLHCISPQEPLRRQIRRPPLYPERGPSCLGYAMKGLLPFAQVYGWLHNFLQNSIIFC